MAIDRTDFPELSQMNLDTATKLALLDGALQHQRAMMCWLLRCAIIKRYNEMISVTPLVAPTAD